jgi:hypothetical protein
MTQSTKQFKLDKNIWTEADFDSMNWHDNPIHAITFGDNFELLLDIDYVFEWVLKGKKYLFWISPCTLMFENVYDLTFDIGPTTPGLTIDFLTKENSQRPKNSEYIKRDIEFDWTIEMQEGTISFKSVGFKQYVRQLPQLLRAQKMAHEARGGLSFAITSA